MKLTAWILKTWTAWARKRRIAERKRHLARLRSENPYLFKCLSDRDLERHVYDDVLDPIEKPLYAPPNFDVIADMVIVSTLRGDSKEKIVAAMKLLYDAGKLDQKMESKS